MLRITETLEDAKAARLKLEGVLTSENYPELNAVIQRNCRYESRTLILDMRGVTYLDENAACELTRLRSERLSVINCSPFVETMLDAVARKPTNGR
jgi:anti-anti-sigma regulatory factor